MNYNTVLTLAIEILEIARGIGEKLWTISIVESEMRNRQ